MAAPLRAVEGSERLLWSPSATGACLRACLRRQATRRQGGHSFAIIQTDLGAGGRLVPIVSLFKDRARFAAALPPGAVVSSPRGFEPGVNYAGRGEDFFIDEGVCGMYRMGNMENLDNLRSLRMRGIGHSEGE